jgi:hypothetical protein
MATSSTTTGIIVGIGALTEFLISGNWTWRSFFISAGGSVAGLALAFFITNASSTVANWPDSAQYAVVYFCGFFANKIIHRINKLTVKATIGPVEIESKGDEQ